MEEESWRNHEGGIMEKESWRRNHGGGTLEEESWRRDLGGIWEASGRLLGAQGGTQRHPRRHPGGTQGSPGGQRRLGGKVCQNICVFLIKVARPTFSPARERPDPHEVRSSAAKVGERGPGNHPINPPPSL